MAQTEDYIHLLKLCAVFNTLHAFRTHLQSQVVRLLCDNTVVVATIWEGFSLLDEMRALLCTLHVMLLVSSINLIPQWVASKRNATMDTLSHLD